MTRVFVIGDSISIQYGPYLERFLAGRLHYARKSGESEALANLDVPQGANGGDSSMVLKYLRGLQQANALQADVLLINCGLHDIKTTPATGQKQVTLADYRRNLQEIIATATQMGPELVWITTTPCDEAVHNAPTREFHRFAADNDAYRAVATELMTAAGVKMIDLYTFTTQLGPDLYCDHVHFHEPIRQMQAAYIAGWLIGRFGEPRGAR